MSHSTSSHPLSTQTGAPVSRLGIGCGRLGSISNLASIGECKRALAAALDAGITLFDTADSYGQGDSERILAGVLSKRRREAFVVTKIGTVFPGATALHKVLKPAVRLAARYVPPVRAKVLAKRGHASTVAQNFEPAYLASALDASLLRLQTDAVDALLLHNPPESVLSDPETARFLEQARGCGKVRYAGVSVLTEAEAAAALRMPTLDVLQMEVGLAAQIAATATGRAIGERNIPVMVYGALRTAGAARDDAPEATRAALASAFGLPHVRHVIVGLSSRQHLTPLVDTLKAL